MTTLYEEAFEAASGYDSAIEGEYVSVGETLDPDFATAGIASPVGWGAQCLHCKVNAVGDDAYYTATFTAAPVTYTRLSFIIHSHPLDASGETLTFCQLEDSHSSDIDWLVRLRHDGTDVHVNLRAYYDGDAHSYYSLSPIVLDTRYLLEVKWDISGHDWAWRMDGVDQPNNEDSSAPITDEGSLSSGHASTASRIYVGFQDTGYGAAEGYFDIVGIRNTTWIGDASSPSSSPSQSISSSPSASASSSPSSSPSPQPEYYADYTWSLTVGGVERWAVLLRDSLTLVEAEGSQVNSLRCAFEDYSDVLTVTEYQEVILKATEHDGVITKLFGGYAVKITPEMAPGGAGRRWNVVCEGYETLFTKTSKLRQTWVNTTTKALVAALFAGTGLNEFNVTTHVATGLTVDTFATDETGETLAKILDRLVQLNSDAAMAPYAWRVDVDKNLWLGPQTSDTAPFSLCETEDANWITTYPMVGVPTKTIDATQVINRVTVRGGFTPSSSYQTDTFSGNGSTTLFKLSHRPVLDVVRVRIASTRKTHGHEWHHDDYLGVSYDNLIDYASGTLRFNTAPGAGTNNVTCKYRYRGKLDGMATDAASFAKYGRWFDFEYSNMGITRASTATAIADAILNAYSDAVVGGVFAVGRLGIRAGQRVQIEFAPLTLTGYYPVRQVTTELDKAQTGVVCTVQYGGLGDKLSAAAAAAKITLVGFGIETPPPYEEPPTPETDTSIGTARVVTRLEIIDPNTDYSE